MGLNLRCPIAHDVTRQKGTDRGLPYIHGEASCADSLTLQEKNRKNGENSRKMCPKGVRVVSCGCIDYQSLDALPMLSLFIFWTPK